MQRYREVGTYHIESLSDHHHAATDTFLPALLAQAASFARSTSPSIPEQSATSTVTFCVSRSGSTLFPPSTFVRMRVIAPEQPPHLRG